MTGDDFDLAPPPAERLEIFRASSVGWYVAHDREIVACFKTAVELAQWIEEVCGSVDPVTGSADPLPTALQRDPGQPRRSLWGVISGGRK